MGNRIGVDVGGTFTKAIAFDLEAGAVVAQSVVPTTHLDANGVAAGVVAVVADIAQAVGADTIELVVHSTTQAVNALLEGDTAAVGVVGLGRRPELARARKRTELRRIEVAPGRFLDTRPVFFDVSDGLDDAAVTASLRQLVADGVATVCVAEAFAPDDSRNEQRVAELAAAIRLPACTSSELSGLYGLELRAVTAALNASVLPIASATAAYVEDGLRAAGVTAPLMIMRGDGGATDMAGFRATPARTLYSGPAASVAGALRFTNTTDAVVVEVGGTSTNVAAIRRGHPSLSYVQVASHTTALRAVDVRVLGVAGGSMLRTRKRRVYGVGPRSAHIAGLAYAAFAPAGTFTAPGSPAPRVVEFAPRHDDPADYLAIETADGTRWALTNTCAAVALGLTHDDDYAHADPPEAAAAFAVAGAHLRLAGDEVARRMLEASGTAICELVAAVAADAKIAFPPPLVAVGGGAGGLGRHVAAMLRTECTVPARAEVISSIGDALSLLRAERERTADASDPDLIESLIEEVEAEVTAAGASPASIEVRVDEQPEKGTVRAVATGAVALESGAIPGRHALDEEAARRTHADLGLPDVLHVGSFWVARGGTGATHGRVAAMDQWGDLLVDLVGDLLVDPPLSDIADAVKRHTRHRGPVTVEPPVWVLTHNRLYELDSGDRAAPASALVEAARRRHGSDATGQPAVAIIVGSN
jgi:N-methylhydantoinase A/oxoprolinase/acetone carboxylase beta subunit